MIFLLLKVMLGSPDMDALGRKKVQQRCKRQARPEKDKVQPKYKRRKKEEEEKTLHCSTSSPSEPLITHLRQVHTEVISPRT